MLHNNQSRSFLPMRYMVTVKCAEFIH